MSNLHPLFAAILAGIEQQPTMLQRASIKASPRRFSGEAPSGYMPLRGSEREQEIWDGEREAILREEQDERDEREERGLS